MDKLNIFHYLDYRKYLTERFARMPKKGRGEFARIAKHLSITTSQMSQVASRARELREDQALLVAEYLGLSDLEIDYWMLLIQMERAPSAHLKKYVLQKVKALQEKSLSLVNQLPGRRILTEEDKAIFYSSWHYSAIHLYCSTQEKGVTLADVMKRFGVEYAKAYKCLQFLVSTGLCDERKGHYLMTTQSTYVPKNSEHLQRHHTNWRLRAIERNGTVSDEELMYTVQLSLARADFGAVRDLAFEFIKRVDAIVKPSPAEEVAALNIDLFWVK